MKYSANYNIWKLSLSLYVYKITVEAAVAFKFIWRRKNRFVPRLFTW